jgi:hypothetical protein
MPAYLVSIVDVKDSDWYLQYAKAANEAAAKHGGKFLLRGHAARSARGHRTRQSGPPVCAMGRSASRKCVLRATLPNVPIRFAKR